jgi:hypothetical protein
LVSVSLYFAFRNRDFHAHENFCMEALSSRSGANLHPSMSEFQLQEIEKTFGLTARWPRGAITDFPVDAGLEWPAVIKPVSSLCTVCAAVTFTALDRRTDSSSE